MAQALRQEAARRPARHQRKKRKIAGALKRPASLSKRIPAAKPTKVTKSSGNVFADIGLPNPEEHLLKAELVRRIAATMEEQKLNQTSAAALLSVTQPDISKMLKGHFRQFSVERLMRFLVALGSDVEIVVHPRAAASDKHAKITVTADRTIARGAH
jgi:predicted XRE-type DNA-binding protein